MFKEGKKILKDIAISALFIAIINGVFLAIMYFNYKTTGSPF